MSTANSTGKTKPKKNEKQCVYIRTHSRIAGILDKEMRVLKRKMWEKMFEKEKWETYVYTSERDMSGETQEGGAGDGVVTRYGVATISRLLKIIDLSCRIWSLL